MLLTTQTGLYEVLSDETNADLLRVGSTDPEALQAATDGIALVDGGEDPERLDRYWIRADRNAVAEWVAHEVRQYVTYTDNEWMRRWNDK